ncbi:uncharacterized protein LOC103519986 [Diaphorina citri]|uniref:Uncharacterized protein LOC103519986 n=1 Tax=Diaphorina citri TaxID=121845 RepID=A0A1S3DK92_DIACI|nr:uncharacterized protein LOC103519986 [Diaphorina citri]
MWMLISSRATEMTKYKETELEDEEFIRDEMGYPVHPKYLTRSIRYVSQHKQFILNVLFYILLLLVVTKKVLCHYLHLMWDLLCCCCKPVTGLTAKTRIRGGEDVEADDFIRNANREVLEVRDVLHNSMYVSTFGLD